MPDDLHLRQTDTFAWRLERDPALRSTIVGITLLDRVPDWTALRHRIDLATRLAPTFRHRLVASPLGLASPRWVPDPDFDLDWHVRRVAAPAPAGLAEVLGLARVAGMTAFDPARPLWEATLVEGVDGDRAALVLKVHHALTDGIGGIQLAAHVVDLDRDADRAPDLPPVLLGPAPGGAEMALEALGHDLRAGVERLSGAVRALPSALRALVTRPASAASEGLATARSVARFVRPITSTLSPLMTDRRLRWQYDAIEVPFAELRAAGRAVGGTVNDAYVGGVTGGLRRYHEHHGVPVGELRLTMPVSMRRVDDPEGGNRVTLVRLPVPVGIADPAERMRAIDERCRAARAARALPFSDVVAAVLNTLPAPVTGSMLKHVDVLASNVPGFPDGVYLAGARIERFYPFGPTLGSAANLTLMSYAGTCCIGINTDGGAVPDPEVFCEALREGFAEVLALAS